VAPTQYSQIAWAALFGALFFNEPMTADAALGMAIIALAGVIIVIRQNRPRIA
jgi:drug/metabolite transporter (DMT)-like permease